MLVLVLLVIEWRQTGVFAEESGGKRDQDEELTQVGVRSRRDAFRVCSLTYAH